MLNENEEKFFYNEEKLNFIINHIKLDVKEIAHLFGVKPAYISKLREQSHNSLKPMHLYAFSSAFNIPYKIFDKNVNTTEQIKTILEKEKKVSKELFFKKNKQLLEDIKGDWYAYFYPSNQFSDIYRIKTSINNDGTIIDENNNFGKLLIGTNQSLIIKEAFNSKNLITIVFDNHKVAYDLFHFSLISKRNHIPREMFNFGFFSRQEIPLDKVQKILGEKEKIQLKMLCEFEERIAEYVEFLG
jgi:transcriptional regulator with XRE-family HTH domain